MTQQDKHRSHDRAHGAHDEDGQPKQRQDGEPLAEPDHRFTAEDQAQPEDASYDQPPADDPLSLDSTDDDETRAQPGG